MNFILLKSSYVKKMIMKIYCFKDWKTTKFSSMLMLKRNKGYCTESVMSCIKLGVTWNYVYSPFNCNTLQIFNSFVKKRSNKSRVIFLVLYTFWKSCITDFFLQFSNSPIAKIKSIFLFYLVIKNFTDSHKKIMRT